MCRNPTPRSATWMARSRGSESTPFHATSTSSCTCVATRRSPCWRVTRGIARYSCPAHASAPAEERTMNDIRVATVQFQHFAGDKPYNLERVQHFVELAKERGVELIVFPEMCI